MAFARKFIEKEQAYIIEWQHEKTPAMIAIELNRWPENKADPRTKKGVQDFLYRRRRLVTPGDE